MTKTTTTHVHAATTHHAAAAANASPAPATASGPEVAGSTMTAAPVGVTALSTGVVPASQFLSPPPAPDPAFVPPPGFVPDNALDFRGVLPRTAELIALPEAVRDLAKFTNFAEVMGSKAPSLAQTTEAFTVTDAWSSARTRADAWDKYARTQEGIAWTALRQMFLRLAPSFAVAVMADPSLLQTYPGLATLLGAKKSIARKAVATKKANAKDKAEGKEPTHGKVGKRATKTAQKAALVTVQGQQAAAGRECLRYRHSILSNIALRRSPRALSPVAIQATSP
jgi:hypothetical protein